MFGRSGGGTWSQTAQLSPDDATAGDHFGFAVSLSGDTALVGASGDDDNGRDSGSAYVFRESGGTWSQAAKLKPADGWEGDWFGRNVVLSGSTALIGAPSDSHRINGVFRTDCGSAYVFEESDGTWAQVAKLNASDGANYDLFGWALALDGSTALIGSAHDDPLGHESGSAYVFRKVGGTWTEIAKLTPSDGAEGDQFGYSVALDGSTAIVGALYNDENGQGSGAAYVFQESGGTWSQVAKLTATDGGYMDYFGHAVALSGDTALVGAYGDDGACSGSAYVFQNTGGVWSQAARLVSSDRGYDDAFGWSVALDGATAVVGARTHNGDALDSGAAYVFMGEVPDEPPLADAGGPYQFTAAQLQIALDGSGSSDDLGVAAYDWDVDAGTTTLSGVAPTLHIKDSGLTSQADVVALELTVTDTGGMTDDDATTVSYLGSDPVVNSFDAIILGDFVNFVGEIQDDDLAVNQWLAGFQEVAWELDGEQALTAGDVGDGFISGLVGGSTSAVTISIDETVHLSQFAPGSCTVWLNVAGSLTTTPVTFWNHYPEPSSLALLALGGLGLLRRRKRR